MLLFIYKKAKSIQRSQITTGIHIIYCKSFFCLKINLPVHKEDGTETAPALKPIQIFHSEFQFSTPVDLPDSLFNDFDIIIK